ncbi:MAG: hypothetical protein Q8M44_00765 [bacterium]|nr:hypothetical protein [bacterium]
MYITVKTNIITANNDEKANIIHEINNQAKLHNQQYIFLFENNLEYSLGSDLFIIYEKLVTSEISLIIQ